MAEEGGNKEVVFTFKEQGAQQVAAGAKAVQKAVQDLDAGLAKFKVSGEKAFNKAQVEYLENYRKQINSVKDASGGFGSTLDKLQGSLSAASTQLRSTGGQTGLFSVALDTANQGLTIIRNPLGAVVTGLAALAAKSLEAANEMVGVYKSMRQLQSVTGETAEKSEDIADAFELAGVSGDQLTTALFRLGNQLETGGKGLQKIGVEIRNSSGEFKTEGEVLLETREKISAIGDSSQRTAALMEIFGRAGRSMGPAFSLPREEFEKLVGVAEKYNTVSPAMMEGAKNLAKAQAETKQAMEQLNAEIAKTIGFELGNVFEFWKQKAIGLATELAKSERLFTAIGAGIGGGLLGPAGAVIGGLLGYKLDEARATTKMLEDYARGQEAIMKKNIALAKQAEELRTPDSRRAAFLKGDANVAAQLAALDEEAAVYDKRKAAAKDFSGKMVQVQEEFQAGLTKIPKGRLAKPEAEELAAKIAGEYASYEKRLQGLAEFEAQRAKIQEGSDAKGIAAQIAVTDQLTKIEIDRFQKDLAVRRAAEITGKLDPKDEAKLMMQHQEKLSEIESQGAKLRLQQRVALAADSKKLLDKEVRDRQTASQAYLAVISTQFEREKAALDLFARDSIQAAEGNREREVRAAEQTKSAKISALDAEGDRLRAYAEQYKDVASVQEEVESRLRDLQNQRVQAGQEADKALLNSRKTYLQQIKAMASEEAGIGQSIEQKAISSLQARGKKKISQADISEESARLGDRARETRAAFTSGGKVKAEDLQASREYGGTLASLQKVGGTRAGALQQFEAQQGAAYSNQPFSGIPSGMAGQSQQIQALAGLVQEQSNITAQGASRIEQTYVKAFDGVTTAVGNAIATIKQKIQDGNSEIAEDLYTYVEDKLIRRIEQQAARS